MAHITATGERRRVVCGFTLIELLVVLAIVALMLTLVTPHYLAHVRRSKETALHGSLQVMRDAIDKFEGDQGRLPDNLDELVQRRYLRAMPQDPITGRTDTWVEQHPDEVPGADANARRDGLADVHSSASGNGLDDTPYTSW